MAWYRVIVATETVCLEQIYIHVSHEKKKIVIEGNSTFIGMVSLSKISEMVRKDGKAEHMHYLCVVLCLQR